LNDGECIVEIVLRILPLLRQFFGGSCKIAIFVQIADDALRKLFHGIGADRSASCHARCSLRPLGEDRNFSNEGRSETSRSCDCPPSPPVSRYWLKKLPTSNSSKGLASGFSGTFSVSAFRKFSSL